MTLNKSCHRFICILLSIMLLFGIFVDCRATAFAYDEPILDAPVAVAVDHKAKGVLYKKNEDKRVQIGALSNLMVALVAADKSEVKGELQKNIEEMLKNNSDEAINNIIKETYNDTDKFVKAMNKKAKELGCKKTTFVECYGYGKKVFLADKDEKTKKVNTSSMSDIAKMTIAFFNEKELKDFAKVDKKSKNLSYGVLIKGDGNKKGICEVVFGEKGDSQFTVVSVGGVSSKVNSAEGIELLFHVFDRYRSHKVFVKGKSTGKIKIKGGEKNYVEVYAKDDLYVDLPKEGEESLLETRSVVNGDIVAPVKKGTVVGKMEVLEADEVTGSVPIVVGEDVKKGGPLSKIGISDYMLRYLGIIGGVFLILFIILRIRIARVKKKKRERIKRKRQAEAMRIARERKEKRDRGWPID